MAIRNPTLTLGGALALGLLLQPVLPAGAEERMWVAIDDLQRRTCPSTECGVVGRFFFQESVIVFEKEDEWSRVSRYHSAGCYEGVSAFVEEGNPECSADNGIRGGEFAEWVQSKFLAAEPPERAVETHG